MSGCGVGTMEFTAHGEPNYTLPAFIAKGNLYS